METITRGVAPLALAISIGTAACNPSTQGNISSSRDGFTTNDPVEKIALDSELREACGDLGPSLPGASSFTRTPYLQKTTAVGTDVMWTSPSSAAMKVIATTPDGEIVAEVPARVDEQANRPEYVQYVATLEGLDPDAVYCYEIFGDGQSWMRAAFRTAPPRGTRDPIDLMVMGDLGTRTPDQFAVLEQFQKVNFDLALITGDVAYTTGTLEEHEQNFFQVYQDVLPLIPFFVVPGNHDYAEGGSIFREVFGLPENGGPRGLERWYSFDWGSVHIVGLDTEDLNPQQAAWLDDDLAANDLPWTIVVLHKPPYSSGSHGSDAPTAELFVPIFEKHQVDLVLAGHEHNYERTEAINGVTYVVTGGGGRGTRAVGTSPFTAYSEAVAHFTFIRIERNTLRLNAIDAAGNDFDFLEIVK